MNNVGRHVGQFALFTLELRFEYIAVIFGNTPLLLGGDPLVSEKNNAQSQYKECEKGDLSGLPPFGSFFFQGTLIGLKAQFQF